MNVGKVLDNVYFILISLVNTAIQRKIDSLLLENINWHNQIHFLTRGDQRELPIDCALLDFIEYNNERITKLKDLLIDDGTKY